MRGAGAVANRAIHLRHSAKRSQSSNHVRFGKVRLDSGTASLTIGQLFHDRAVLAPLLQRLRRLSPIKKVTAIGFAVIILLLALTTIMAARRHNAELTDAARELRTLDLLLAEETSRSFQNVSLVLGSIADEIGNDGVTTSEAFNRRESTLAVHEALKTRADGIPQLDAITIVNADGKLINFSRSWPVPDVQLNDRDYFGYLRDHPLESTYLSEPVLNRSNGTPTLYLVRRLNGPDGTLIGLVLGAIEISYFERLYISLHLDPGNLIALWREDGVLLARFPPAKLGQRMPPSEITPEVATWHGVPDVSEKLWTIDNGVPEARIVASQRVDGFPLRINIARSKSLILGDWRREVLVTFGFVLIAILCIGALIWAIVRRFHAYEEVATAAKERERAILARQNAEEALRQSQKMEAVGQLTGGVAHDFNNMLTVIQSSVELMRRDEVSDQRRRRYVEAIADAAERAAKLTAQLLAFSRRQALQPEVFDAAENVASISQMLDRLTGSHIHFETKIPDGPCLVNADPNQFDTAIVNMAVNARDAMPDGGRLTITVKATDHVPGTRAKPSHAGAFVAVSISDTGGGIAPETVDRVFEPFFTTKKVGQGTGLGLSQVIGFAQQSGGEVSVVSAIGQGSTFTLHLPQAADDRRVVREAKDLEVVPDGRGARVLVVDDDPQVGRLATHMLKELKYFATLVGSAEEALALLGEDPDGFKVVFSDVVMPGMDGLALTRTIRDRFPGLPVLLTTGFSAALADSSAGAFPVLQKPYAINELARALHRVITAGAQRVTPASRDDPAGSQRVA